MEEITGVLLVFNQRRKASYWSSQGEGLVAKGNIGHGRNKSRSESSRKKFRSKSRRRNDIQCYKYEKNENIKRECPEWKKGNTKNKEGSSTSTNVVEGDSESGDGDMLSISFRRDHLTDSWIMDSACSYHMVPNKD